MDIMHKINFAQKKMTKHKDPQEDNEEMIREQNKRIEDEINRKVVRNED